MKKNAHRTPNHLLLSTEKVRTLANDALKGVAGGAVCSDTCAQYQTQTRRGPGND